MKHSASLTDVPSNPITETLLWLKLLTLPPAYKYFIANLIKETSEFHIVSLLDQPELTKIHTQLLQPTSAALERALAWLLKKNCLFITLSHPAYPPALRAITDPPLALFVLGSVHWLKRPQIGVVGSRVPSEYGKKWGDYFSSQLAQAGFVITSGLALGIDSIAHQATIDHHKITIAVLGNGLATVYPKRNGALFHNLLASGGTIISEYLPYEPPLPHHFPARNRIISGLSLGVVVVEAHLKSGSLITAQHAADQGREVFVVPGPLDAPGSEGGYQLIKAGAILADAPRDIYNAYCNMLETRCDDSSGLLSYRSRYRR